MSDNLFSGLVHRRTAGIVREFVLWCVVCFAALLSLIAMVVGRGNITWIMLMFFSIGMGVIMAFRLTLVALLYSSGVFCLITVAIHYICFAGVGSYYDDVSYSALNIILFVLILLTAIALVVCEFVHLFTRYNLGDGDYNSDNYGSVFYIDLADSYVCSGISWEQCICQ